MIEGLIAALIALGGAAEAPQEAKRSDNPPVAQVAVRLQRPAKLRQDPKGRVIATIEPWTEFGSPQVLKTFARRGPWVAVSSHLADNRIGWVKRPRGRRVRIKERIVADLSRRRATYFVGKSSRRSFRIGVGGPASPTPAGRFQVTDRLLTGVGAGRALSSSYGAGVLAISAIQPNLPPGWSGGNRMALHGTDQPSSVGEAQSNGCLRLNEEDIRFLLRKVKLGTPVLIRK